ncbi:MAG: hypothetical protein ABSA45_12985 [Verrucomicrobiota bacterium]
MKSNTKHKRTHKKTSGLSLEQVAALPLEKKRQLHLVPQEPKPGMIVVRGDELIEAMMLVADPKKRSEDILLLRGKRAASSLKIANLSDSEIRGASWFAHVPEFPGDISQAIFNEGNFYASSFWTAWRRNPETVLRLVKKIRESWPLTKVVDLGREKVEAVIKKTAKLNYQADDYEKMKVAVKRDRRKLNPPDNVQKFTKRLSQE